MASYAKRFPPETPNIAPTMTMVIESPHQSANHRGAYVRIIVLASATGRNGTHYTLVRNYRSMSV